MNVDDLKDIVPSVVEVQQLMDQELLEKDTKEIERAAAQLTQVASELRECRSFPMRYSGSLNDYAKSALEAVGWSLKNVTVLHPHASPSRMPDWEINIAPRDEVMLRI
jgi:hypothetical protein